MTEQIRGGAPPPEGGFASKVAFVDASALVALADQDDASHAAAAAAYHDLVSGGFRLFTTDLALVSAHELLTAALGPEIARSWLAQCAIHVQSVTAADLDGAAFLPNVSACVSQTATAVVGGHPTPWHHP